jgi:cobalt-zinc-cadmium efflux system protein
VAVISDAIHDIGDAISIGLSWILEKISKKHPDNKYTYGYIRYSVIGSLITTLILLSGSVIVAYNAIIRLINPVEINYNGMIFMSVIGVSVNFLAAYFTKDGDSLNQKAVNLHMLEDVLGWVVVLVGAIIMRFTDISLIDPLMSIGVSIFIFINAFKNLTEVVNLFLEKTPASTDVEEIKEHLLEIEEINDVHHIHIWSMDGISNYATMHIVTDEDGHRVKDLVRNELKEHGIVHVTLELEKTDEHCHEEHCHPSFENHNHHHHHHHHH